MSHCKSKLLLRDTYDQCTVIYASSQLLTHLLHDYYIIDFQAVINGWIAEYQRQDPKINQVHAVDASKSFCYDHTQAQISWSQRGMLTAGALSIVFTADNRVRSWRHSFQGTFVIGRINNLKREFADFRNIAAIG